MVGFGNQRSCWQPLRGAVAARLLTATVCLFSLTTAIAATPTPAPRPMPVIEAGTVVDDPARDRWNRIVLLATPRFKSGDTDAVSDSIRKTVTGFTFVVLATVKPLPAADESGKALRHELVEVGVGYSMLVKDRLTVIAPDAKLEGLTLDFLGRQILSAKQRSLTDITCVGRHGTAVAFDTPTLMLRGDDHEELLVRHLVRIDPATGDCTTCAWMVAPAGEGGPVPVEEPLRIIAGGTREERPIHVDGSRFTFGFPTKQAFAVEDLPPGRRVDWSASLRTAAHEPTYSETALERLTKELDTAVASLRTLRSAER
ncbi:MAG: hypothetical protein ACKO6B_07930 [Planctomycetia bacterium]